MLHQALEHVFHAIHQCRLMTFPGSDVLWSLDSILTPKAINLPPFPMSVDNGGCDAMGMLITLQKAATSWYYGVMSVSPQNII